MPYYLNKLIKLPVWSLADHELFVGNSVNIWSPWVLFPPNIPTGTG